MNSQSSFTSCFYNKEIKISKHSHELSIEVLNLETLHFFSCTIKEQDLNQSFNNLEKLFKLLCDGLQKNSKTVRTTIIEDMTLSLWIAGSDPFEYPLVEVPFMSSEHLERFQQRITDCNDFSLYLPKNPSGVWSALLLKNQLDQNKKLKQPQQEGIMDDSLAEKFRELEEQVKQTKEDNKLLKTQIKNLESHLGINLRDFEERLKIFSKVYEQSKISSGENEELRHQMQKMVEELRELKTKLDTKGEKAHKEIKGLQDIDFVESVNLHIADPKKTIEDVIRDFDEKIAKVYEFITNAVRETKETNERAINSQKEANEEAIKTQNQKGLEQYCALFTKIERNYTNQTEQTNQKFEDLNAKLEKLKDESRDLPEKITNLGERMSQLQNRFEVLQGQVQIQDQNNIVDYVNRTVQGVKEALEEDIDTKRVGDADSFEAKLEQLKQTQTNYVNQKVQETINNLEAERLVNEEVLKNRIDTLAELFSNM